jgi:hypothetical protein
LTCWIIFVVVAGFSTKPVGAAQLDLGAGYRVERSDNITRVHDPALRISDVTNSVIAQMLLTENSGTIVARIAANASYDHYLHESFENQTSSTLDAYGEGYLVERLFSWVVADGFRQLLVDPLESNTPTNRTNSNAWETGPNLYFRFGAVDTLKLEARYGRTRIDDPELNYQRNSYASRWLHRASPRTVFSLNYEWLNLNYDLIDASYGVSEPYPDINRHRAYLRFDYREAGSIMNANIGWTHIEQQGGQAEGLPLYQLSVTRQTGTSSSYGIRFRSEYSDVGGELLPAVPAGEPSADAAGIPVPTAGTVSQGPFALKHFEFFYLQTGVMFPTTLQLFYRDTEYLYESENDREEIGATVSVMYAISPSLSFQILGSYQTAEYFQQVLPATDIVRKDHDSHVGAVLTYRLTPRLRAGLEARRYARRSSWEESGYIDDRFALTLTYQTRLFGR